MLIDCHQLGCGMQEERTAVCRTCLPAAGCRSGAAAPSPLPDAPAHPAPTRCCAGDPLGRMKVSQQAVVQRDCMVWQAALDHRCGGSAWGGWRGTGLPELCRIRRWGAACMRHLRACTPAHTHTPASLLLRPHGLQGAHPAGAERRLHKGEHALHRRLHHRAVRSLPPRQRRQPCMTHHHSGV